MPIVCPDCGKEFKTLHGLYGHSKVHKTKPKLFKCLNCGKSTVKKRTALGKYCSNKCQAEWEWENIYKPRIEQGEGGNLRKYLTERDGYKCSECGISKWHGEELSLHVDHIDGNSDNNDPNNLRFLCPNCDSQTETYKGRNKKRTKRNRYLRKYKKQRRNNGN